MMPRAIRSPQSVVRGPWSVVRGPWSVVCGLWSVVYDLWSVVRGPNPSNSCNRFHPYTSLFFIHLMYFIHKD